MFSLMTSEPRKLRAMYVEGEEEVTCPKSKQKVMKRKVARGGAIRTAAAERREKLIRDGR